MVGSESFSLHLPHTILFGTGKAKELPNVLPPFVKRVMLICGSHAAISGEGVCLKSILETAGIAVSIYSGVPAEPPPESVDSIVLAARQANAQTLIALGGGSVMDAAKAAAAIIHLEGTCVDYFSGKSEINPLGRIPLACLPTTAGTGAESTSNAVLTDSATKVKKSLRHPSMVPEIAIVDPDFTLECPAHITAASGLDALVQAIESYISPRATSITRDFSKNAFRRITSSIIRCYEYPQDISARIDMAEGAMLAGMAFANSGLGAIHGIAHPVGSLLHVPHGVACSILMLPVFRFNCSSCAYLYENLFAEIAGKLQIACTADNFLAYLADLCNALNIAKNFRYYGLAKEHYSFILANCRSGSMKNNPVYMTDADVIAILDSVS